MKSIVNYFFTNNNTPSAHKISDLQRRATWIALTLILQALNEIDHNYYLPFLKQFTSLPPLLLLLGSFYALWMAIRPARAQRPIVVGTSHAGKDEKVEFLPSKQAVALTSRSEGDGDRKGRDEASSSSTQQHPEVARETSTYRGVDDGLAPSRPLRSPVPQAHDPLKSAPMGTSPVRPQPNTVETDARPSSTQPQPRLWQRIVLFLTLILTIPGTIQLGYTTFICFTPPVFTNDGTSLDTNAAILLLAGHNPYTDSNILQITRRFHIQPNWTTPLRRGTFANHLDYPTMDEFQKALDTAQKTGDASAFESKVSYPALSFLTLLPFVALHDYNVQPFYLLCYFLLVLLAWKWTQHELRPWVILLAVANVPMLASTMGGNLDIFYTLLIVLAWRLRDRRWFSALFFGLALASKQIAWYFVPFYFIMNWRLYGFKEAVYRLLFAGTLGLLINLPFILWNPQAWLSGVLAPVADPMFPMGVGIVNLSVTHLIPYLPERVYTALQLAAFLVSIACYWRMSRTRPESAIFFAVLPLFFNWRSLSSYFYCVAYPLFVLMAARSRPPLQAQEFGTNPAHPVPQASPLLYKSYPSLSSSERTSPGS
jgi:hypothetical protein